MDEIEAVSVVGGVTVDVELGHGADGEFRGKLHGKRDDQAALDVMVAQTVVTSGEIHERQQPERGGRAVIAPEVQLRSDLRVADTRQVRASCPAAGVNIEVRAQDHVELEVVE